MAREATLRTTGSFASLHRISSAPVCALVEGDVSAAQQLDGGLAACSRSCWTTKWRRALPLRSSIVGRKLRTLAGQSAGSEVMGATRPRHPRPRGRVCVAANDSHPMVVAGGTARALWLPAVMTRAAQECEATDRACGWREAREVRCETARSLSRGSTVFVATLES